MMMSTHSDFQRNFRKNKKQKNKPSSFRCVADTLTCVGLFAKGFWNSDFICNKSTTTVTKQFFKKNFIENKPPFKETLNTLNFR